MRSVLTTVAQGVGLGLVVLGVGMISVPVAFVVGGVALAVVAEVWS